MAVITVPARGKVAKLREALAATRRVLTSVSRPYEASVRTLTRMPLFVAGCAAIDFSAFHVSHALGWLITGVSLFVGEFVAADE